MRGVRNLEHIEMGAVAPDDIHAARLTVCDHATDTDEARMLLQMLGLA